MANIFSGKKGRNGEYQFKDAEKLRKSRIEAARAKDRAYRKSRLDARKDLFKEYKNAIDSDFEGMTDKEKGDIQHRFIKSIYDLIDEETSKELSVYDSDGIIDVIRQLDDETEYLTAKNFKFALEKDKEEGNAGRKGSLDFFV